MRLALVLVTLFVVLGPGLAWSGSEPDDNWPMYGANLGHTFSNPRSQIKPGDVSTLVPAWTFATGDAVSASPAVVDGVVYIGAWDGFFYALYQRPYVVTAFAHSLEAMV